MEKDLLSAAGKESMRTTSIALPFSDKVFTYSCQEALSGRAHS
jgi:hypothetical protein